MAVGALVLAAPVLNLVLIYDVVTGSVWYAWPIALAGVLLGAALAGRYRPAAVVVAAAAVPLLALAADLGDVNRTLGELIIWSFLLLIMAAVGAAIGTAAQAYAGSGAVPALAGLITAGAVGAQASSLSLVSAGSDLNLLTGPAGSVIAAVLLVGAAGLLLALGRRGRRAGEIPQETLTPADGV